MKDEFGNEFTEGKEVGMSCNFCTHYDGSRCEIFGTFDIVAAEFCDEFELEQAIEYVEDIR